MAPARSLLVIPLLLVAAASGRPTAAAGEETGPGKPPLPIYLGREPERVHGRSRVAGTSHRVVLDPVLQGAVVRHDLVVTNDGPEPLVLRDVEGCPGCIVESWPRTIAPGGEGAISLLLLTDSRGGETISGTVRARTDDPERPEIAVGVSLRVEEVAALEPYRVWLRGRAGEEIVARCRVIPSPDHPFEVMGVRARRGVWFEHELRPTEVEGRPAWEIVLRNTRTKPGPYQDVLFVQTDHPERPELKVRVEGRIEPAASGE